ncbi:hypothetical protein, partial [Streptomyces niveiscabiei]
MSTLESMHTHATHSISFRTGDLLQPIATHQRYIGTDRLTTLPRKPAGLTCDSEDGPFATEVGPMAVCVIEVGS